MLTHYESTQRGSVEVLHVPSDRPFAEMTSVALDAASRRLTVYFDLDAPLPGVRAFLAPDRDAFDALVADVLKVEIERPSDLRRIAQPQRADIVFLSPSAYASQSAYAYVREDYRRMVHHELVHVVQEHLSPNIETSPFWWDEGLAVYISGQWRHESQFRFREPVIDAVQEGCLPSFADIERDPALAYAFGWTLVRFIEQQWGKAAIVDTVTQMGDGDVFATLGRETLRVERAWRAWGTRGDALRA